MTEELPHDAPPPKGKCVVTTCYKDANLYHDMITGRAVTAILHFLNQTPIDWFTKKQATVETATYGSEFAAGKTACQQIRGLQNSLRYLRVPIEDGTHLFGDNESVVTSGTLPDSPLKKRHHGLSYHYVRESVASEVVRFHHIPGTSNPADILSKHWGYQQIWPQLQAILFWQGDTNQLLVKDQASTPVPREGSDKLPDRTPAEDPVETGVNSVPRDSP